MSLDGYIGGTGDEFDRIVVDPDIDFKELSEQFDTYLLGSGVPLVAGLSRRTELELIGQRTYMKTGTVSLVYEVKRSR